MSTEVKCFCKSVYDDETIRKTITRSIEHQQESMKGDRQLPGVTEPSEERCDCFNWLHSKKIC